MLQNERVVPDRTIKSTKPDVQSIKVSRQYSIFVFFGRGDNNNINAWLALFNP